MPADQSSFDVTGVNRNKPAITAGAGLGTAPPAPALDINANDRTGTISFGSGTAPAAGVVLTVTWTEPKDPNRLPKVMLQEANQAIAGLDFAVGAVSSTSFQIVQNTRLVAASQPAGTYALTYWAID